jgi:hypothetical protein
MLLEEFSGFLKRLNSFTKATMKKNLTYKMNEAIV